MARRASKQSNANLISSATHEDVIVDQRLIATCQPTRCSLIRAMRGKVNHVLSQHIAQHAEHVWWYTPGMAASKHADRALSRHAAFPSYGPLHRRNGPVVGTGDRTLVQQDRQGS